MKKVFLISIFVLNTLILSADNYYGKKIGIEDGLSQASITCITYSHQNGALWIGTKFGLNEYSNGSIHPFTEGTCGSCINSIYCDRQNNLWIASAKGLSRIDGHSGAVNTVSADATTCVTEYNDTIYVGGNKGVLHYDRITNSVKGETSPIWTDILNIYSYDGGLICIDRKNGISFIRDGKSDLLNITELNGRTLMASCMDGDELYLSILGEGLIIYNLKDKTIDNSLHNRDKDLAIILSICKVNNDIWIGTDGNGIFILNPSEHSIRAAGDCFSLNPGTELPEAVSCIYQDPFDNIWTGGEQFGLTGLKFSSIRSFLTDQIINTVYISTDKELTFIGTNGDGIHCFSAVTGEKQHLDRTAGMKITSIADYDNNRILFCAYNQGFFLYDTITGSLSSYILKDRLTNARECLYGNAPEIYRTKDGHLIIFAVNNYILNPRNGSCALIDAKQEEYAADLQTVYPLDGDYIYSFSNDGIYRVDIEQNRISRVFEPTAMTGAINCIAYSDSLFVFGTNSGLYRFDTGDSTYGQISTNLFKRVTGLCLDREYNLWVSADNALFKYSNGTFVLIGENSGVAANEISNSTVSPDGTIYLAGTKGLLKLSGSYQGEEIKTSITKTITLNDITVDGVSVFHDSDIIRVPHKTKNLNVTISLHNADPLEKVVYRYAVNGTSYMIETFDENIQVPMLKAGMFSLEVSYLTNDGNWSTPQTILKINKLKPWYKTGVFYILLAVIGLASLMLIFAECRSRMIRALEARYEKRDQSFIDKFESYIADHISDPDLSANDIAREFAMSRASLYAKVKDSFSSGIGEYIERKRIQEAKKLLKETSLSVTEISERTGYSSQRYFSTRFKKCTNRSPLSYRKNK